MRRIPLALLVGLALASGAGAPDAGAHVPESHTVVSPDPLVGEERDASSPLGLTARRTARGIYLTWSAPENQRVCVWRGTGPGSLSLLVQLPPGQGGFLDLAVERTAAYAYGLGDQQACSEWVQVPGQVQAAKILAGLVTTCSGLQQGGIFPANTQNYFSASRHAHVQYYGYFLLRPFDPAPREAKLVWRDPAGRVFSEYVHSITPKRVDLPAGPVGQILLAQAVGLRQVLSQNGQQRVPTRPGLYTIETFVDGVPVALTVFYLRDGGRASGYRK